MDSLFKKWSSFFNDRKLRVHILTLFLSLLVISVVVIISFSHAKNVHEIMDFSKGTIKRVGLLIQERLSCLVSELEQMPTLVAGAFSNAQEIDIHSSFLVSYMLTSVKEFSNLYSLYVGTKEGNFIQVADLTMINQLHFLSDTTKLLPEGAAYALRLIDSAKYPARETWFYKDNHFRTLAQESFPAPQDPRLRPWYTGAESKGALYWSQIYRYDPTGDAGIAVSVPVFDQKKNLIGVVGADLPLITLSHFLSEQKIGKRGKAYLLETSGNVIVPLNEKSSSLVKTAYAQFGQKNDSEFIFKKDGEEYLVYTHIFSQSFGKDWLIMIIAPIDDFFGALFEARRQTVFISILILFLSSLVVVYFSQRVSKPIVLLTKEVDKIKHLDLESEERVPTQIREISLLDQSISSMRVVLRSFGRYIPKDIVKQLMEQGQEIVLGGEKKNVTVMFTDIFDFTSIAECLTIEELMPGLEAYFNIISKVILEHQGTIDKYIGDSVMAFWGAPADVMIPEGKACTAALLCQKALKPFNQDRVQDKQPEFITRIGIHTGDVIVGNIGTAERMNYTVMGDVVNEASRLQQVNKIYHTSIIISEEVQTKLKDQFLVRPLDFISVKGKRQKIKIYEVVAQLCGEITIAPTPEQVMLCDLFNKAYEAYAENRLEEAKALFKMLHKKYPEDYPTQFYLSKMSLGDEI